MNRKILILHSSNELFGADLVLLRAVDALRQEGWEPLVLLPNDLAYEGLLSEALARRLCSVRIMPLGILRRKYLKPLRFPFYLIELLAATLAVKKIIKRERAAMVYSETSAVLCGALAAKLAGRPHVWHLHEILERPRLLVRLLGWLLAHFADRVIAVSNAVYGHWLSLNPALRARLQIIYNGLDLDYYDQPRDRATDRKDLGLRPDEVLVGCLGRIGGWKGQEILLQALANITGQAPQLKCLIGGGALPGEEHKLEELRQLIEHLELGDKVILRSFEPDVRPWLSAMDILAVPSTKPDPFPTVVLEGMAFRLPIIATRHGGPVEMVLDNETGFLVRPAVADALGQALLKLASDKPLRQNQGEAGRKRLEELYPLDKFNQEITRLFGTLLKT